MLDVMGQWRCRMGIGGMEQMPSSFDVLAFCVCIERIGKEL
jgi:hypothetical protein